MCFVVQLGPQIFSKGFLERALVVFNNIMRHGKLRL